MRNKVKKGATRAKERKRLSAEKHEAGRYLYQKIDSDTRAVKARLRQRHRVRIRPGPGRPSAFVAGNKSLGSTSRPKTSPFPRASSGGRLILSKLPKTAETDGSPSGGVDFEGVQERSSYEIKMGRLQEHVRLLRSSHDNAKHDFEMELEWNRRLEDELNCLKREDNVEMRRQRGLIEIEMENKRLRVANKELRRRRQYFRTLEHMHERLHSEQSMFDTTMKAYEMALAVRRLEKQDMRLLSAEVRQVKEVEEQELLNIKDLVHKRIYDWEMDLEDRRRVSKQKKEMHDWFSERRKSVANIAASAKGDLDAKGEAKLKISRQASILQSVSMRSNFRGLKDTADEYEDAFRKIRLATNLSEDDKIIERYLNRESIVARVDAQIEGKREQLAILSCRKEEMLDNLETARLAGMGVPDFNREAVDALSAETDNAKRELGAILSDRTRLKKILIELEQSTHGILTRLDGIRVDSAALHILETPQTGRNSPETTNVHHHRHISTIYSQNMPLPDKILLIAAKLSSLLRNVDTPSLPRSPLLRSATLSILRTPPKEGQNTATESVTLRGAAFRRSDSVNMPESESAEAVLKGMSSMMEELISHNRNNIRVRPPSAGQLKRQCDLNMGEEELEDDSEDSSVEEPIVLSKRGHKDKQTKAKRASQRTHRGRAAAMAEALRRTGNCDESEDRDDVLQRRAMKQQSIEFTSTQKKKEKTRKRTKMKRSVQS